MIGLFETTLALAMLADTATAAPATPAAPPAAKQICKRFAVTGSLAVTKKVCHTKAEWDLLAEQARNDTAEMQRSRGYRAE